MSVKKIFCCICYNVITNSSKSCVLSCYHVYHENCITKWSFVNLACPKCRLGFSQEPVALQFVIEDEKSTGQSKTEVGPGVPKEIRRAKSSQRRERYREVQRDVVVRTQEVKYLKFEIARRNSKIAACNKNKLKINFLTNKSIAITKSLRQYKTVNRGVINFHENQNVGLSQLEKDFNILNTFWSVLNECEDYVRHTIGIMPTTMSSIKELCMIVAFLEYKLDEIQQHCDISELDMEQELIGKAEPIMVKELLDKSVNTDETYVNELLDLDFFDENLEGLG